MMQVVIKIISLCDFDHRAHQAHGVECLTSPPPFHDRV